MARIDRIAYQSRHPIEGACDAAEESTPDRTVLPPPEPPFKGKAEGGRRAIEKTVPVVFSTDDTFDVGEDWGTPISPTYEPTFRFTGTLKSVTVEAGWTEQRAGDSGPSRA